MGLLDDLAKQWKDEVSSKMTGSDGFIRSTGEEFFDSEVVCAKRTMFRKRRNFVLFCNVSDCIQMTTAELCQRALCGVRVKDAACFVYTCRRLIDLSLYMPAIDRSISLVAGT